MIWKRKKKQEVKSKREPDGKTLLFFSPSQSELLESIERIIWTNNGDMIRYYTYSIFSDAHIEGHSCLNLYAQKILNDINKKEG